MKKIFLLATMILFTSQSLFSQEVEMDSITTTSGDKHSILTNRFVFNAGLFIPTKTFKIKVDGSSENEIIDFTEDFDFNKSESTFASNFIWRFSKSKRWSLGVEYFGVKSNHSLNLEDDIEWEDATYPVGVNIEAGFKLNLYRVFVGRVISTGNQHEFGGGLGVHAMDIGSFIEGEAFIGDNVTPTLERRSASIVAPVPNIGLWYFYAPNTKWALTARVDWFSITIGEYGGSLWNVAPGVKYQVSKHIGLGLNYRYIKTSINVDKTDWSGEVNIIFQGPLFTISGNF